MSVSVDQMRSKLYSLEHVQQVLARTEPMKPRTFSVGDVGLKYRAEPGWQHGAKAKDGNEPGSVYAVMGDHSFQLTRSPLEETCLAFGLPRNLATSTPADLLVPQLNYWFRE